MTNLITILGSPNLVLPCPSSYTATTSTIVDEGRNTSGFVVGAVIREDVAKISATFNYITVQQWASILQSFDSKYGGAFFRNIRFYNQVTGQMTTRKMYVADRTTGGMAMMDRNGNPVAWLGATLELTEV